MAKKRIKKKFKKFILFVLLVGIIAGAFYYFTKDKNSSTSFNKSTETSKKEDSKETYPKVSKISLVATGDGLLHNAVYADAYDRSTDTFDFSKQIELVKEEIKDYDIAYYNQESVFGGPMVDKWPTDNAYNVKGYSSYPLFNSPSAFGDAMVDAGFNMVSLASNHSCDCTDKTKTCIENSYNYWASKNVVFDGFNIDESKENKYNIGEKNGIKYGFLEYTNNLNGLDGAISGQEYLIDTYDEETVKKEVEELKKQVDVVIVAMHWHKNSSEYETVPTAANKAIAEYLSSIGVDIVLGTYSHCLQPFDIINDKTVVFYSLGNFISNQGVLTDSIGYKGIVGILASMDIVKTEYEDGTSKIEVNNIGADLLYTYAENSKNFKVIPFSKMESKYNSDYLSIYDDYSNIVTSLNSNITIKPVNK